MRSFSIPVLLCFTCLHMQTSLSFNPAISAVPKKTYHLMGGLDGSRLSSTKVPACPQPTTRKAPTMPPRPFQTTPSTVASQAETCEDLVDAQIMLEERGLAKVSAWATKGKIDYNLMWAQEKKKKTYHMIGGLQRWGKNEATVTGVVQPTRSLLKTVPLPVKPSHPPLQPAVHPENVEASFRNQEAADYMADLDSAVMPAGWRTKNNKDLFVMSGLAPSKLHPPPPASTPPKSPASPPSPLLTASTSTIEAPAVVQSEYDAAAVLTKVQSMQCTAVKSRVSYNLMCGWEQKKRYHMLGGLQLRSRSPPPAPPLSAASPRGQVEPVPPTPSKRDASRPSVAHSPAGPSPGGAVAHREGREEEGARAVLDKVKAMLRTADKSRVSYNLMCGWEQKKRYHMLGGLQLCSRSPPPAPPLSAALLGHAGPHLEPLAVADHVPSTAPATAAPEEESVAVSVVLPASVNAEPALSRLKAPKAGKTTAGSVTRANGTRFPIVPGAAYTETAYYRNKKPWDL